MCWRYNIIAKLVLMEWVPTLEASKPSLAFPYAQHSRRYSGLAPCAHMDAWTLEGCFSDRTSEVLRHSVLTNEIFSQLCQTIESNTSYVPNPTANRLKGGERDKQTNTTTKQLGTVDQQSIESSSKK